MSILKIIGETVTRCSVSFLAVRESFHHSIKFCLISLLRENDLNHFKIKVASHSSTTTMAKAEKVVRYNSGDLSSSNLSLVR